MCAWSADSGHSTPRSKSIRAGSSAASLRTPGQSVSKAFWPTDKSEMSNTSSIRSLCPIRHRKRCILLPCCLLLKVLWKGLMERCLLMGRRLLERRIQCPDQVLTILSIKVWFQGWSIQFLRKLSLLNLILSLLSKSQWSKFTMRRSKIY